MKKIFTNVPIIIFLLFCNLTLSAFSKEDFQKQRGKMVDTILEHSLIYENNNFEISKNVIKALNKAQQELADIEGPLNKQVINAIGPEETAEAIDIWKKLIGVLKLGEHRPGHFKAVKK